MQSPEINDAQLSRRVAGLEAEIARLREAEAARLTTEQELKNRLRQQASVARFGRIALGESNLDGLLHAAVDLVAETLEIEYSSVLELLPEEGVMVMRAGGGGWRKEEVQRFRVSAGPDSQSGYVLATGEPVIVADFNRETRFKPSPVVFKHGVNSSASVIIPGKGRPFGVLNVHAVPLRKFSQDDINFLQSIANLLALSLENHRANEALRQSRDQFAVILEGVADGITASDNTNRIIYANAAAARLIGYASVSALLEASGLEIIDRFEIYDESGQLLAPDRLPGRLVLQGRKEVSTVLRFHNKATGEDRWSIVTSSPIIEESGQVRLAVNIFHDVTPRKQSEERQRFLSEASALLASSLDYTTTLERLASLAIPFLADFCLVDILEKDGTVQSLAEAHRDPAKLPLLGELRRSYRLSLADPAGLGRVLRTGQSLVAGELSEATLSAGAADENHLRLLQALEVHSFMLVPLVIRGRVLGAISFIYGESRRRYGPAELELAEELARRAAMAVDNALLYREAQEAIKAQQELDRIKDRFFSIASHELRTPLTSITGFAQLLQRALTQRQQDQPSGGAELEREARLVAGIRHQAGRMNRLIGEMLDVARLQSGMFELKVTPGCNLLELVQRVVTQQQDANSRNLISLEAGPDAANLRGDWDEARLEQVLNNLISNALKYSPLGSPVVVGLRPDGGTDSANKEVVISVRDRGDGIDPAVQPQIFERFYRVQQGQDRPAEGLGLGLFISREIVEKHGGRIWLESHPGQGATFYFSLPLPSKNQANPDDRLSGLS